MIAKVSGKRSVMVDPRPAELATSIVPRSPSIVRFTTSIPTPRPERLVTVAAVEKPGWKITWNNSLSLSFAPGANSPLSSALV